MSKVIVLDAGHGYHTAGRRCMKKLDPDQTREWYLNDRIMDMVEVLLRDYDCTVLRVEAVWFYGFLGRCANYFVQGTCRKDSTGCGNIFVNEFSLKNKTAQNEKVELQELFYPTYTDESMTLSIALQTLGINYGYAFRKKAASNNIVNYRGTATQNIQMYNLLVAGLLKKA